MKKFSLLIIVFLIMFSAFGCSAKETVTNPSDSEKVIEQSNSTSEDVKGNSADDKEDNNLSDKSNNKPSNSKPNDDTEKINKPEKKDPTQPSKPAHTHSWQAVYTNESVFVREASICSNCGADVTGRTAEHAKAHNLNGEGAGHYSKPIYENRSVLSYYKCSCGATK